MNSLPVIEEQVLSHRLENAVCYIAHYIQNVENKEKEAKLFFYVI